MAASKEKLPRGVTALPTERGGRKFRASIKRGKGDVVHLGIYETPWLAAFAFDVAVRAIGRGDGSTLDIPHTEQPSANDVWEINARVKQRLGLEDRPEEHRRHAPAPEQLLSIFEVAVLGFWKHQAADDSWGHPGAGLDTAAWQLNAAAEAFFWSAESGHPAPIDVMKRLLTRRLDAVFRLQKLTREILDDDGDEPLRIARWLVYPDKFVTGRGRTFVEEIRTLYSDIFADEAERNTSHAPGEMPEWATVLGLLPPFRLSRIREAYRARSRIVHPDVGGSDAEFIRLNAAYEEARAYCESRGL